MVADLKARVDFLLRGSYRVQSHTKSTYSELGGRFIVTGGGLDDDMINRALSQDTRWQGVATSNLRPAWITHRIGAFATEPDILYKRDLFVPADNGHMAVNIVDVAKAEYEWHRRLPALTDILDPGQLTLIWDRLAQLTQVISDEYFLHEAGHLVGVDVTQKCTSDYFRPSGKLLWPLVHAEELRADLEAFGFGIRLLNELDAENVLLYNILLRFGAHRDGLVSRGIAVYGLVPFLLFCELLDVGVVEVRKVDQRIIFTDLRPGGLASKMLALSTRVDAMITTPELELPTMLDRALHVARYLSRRIASEHYVSLFASAMKEHEFVPH